MNSRPWNFLIEASASLLLPRLPCRRLPKAEALAQRLDKGKFRHTHSITSLNANRIKPGGWGEPLKFYNLPRL